MGVETHKVEIVPIKLEPHPNADRLSVVRVYNFTVVVNTADWQGVGKAAYIQPDSVMPDTPEYRFLKDTSSTRKERQELWDKLQPDHESDLARDDYNQKIAALEAKIDANTKYLRITVKKLRGIISMGMLAPIPDDCQICIDEARTGGMSNLRPIPTLQGKYHVSTNSLTLETTRTFCWRHAEIGDDVAEVLGVTHYEPVMINQSKGDDVAPPPPMIYAPKYDVESIYKYADCFEAGEPVHVSEKLDGQNARYVATLGQAYKVLTPTKAATYENYHFHVGSRTEWKKEEGGSNWWRVMEKTPWIKNWMIDHPELVLYGEVFGWVAALRYGAQQSQLFFRAFDVMEGTEYWDAEKFIAEIPADLRAPDLGVMPFDFEKLQGLADGNSLIKGANHMREGIVIKPLKERKHWKLGRVMLKMVSNAYLEKSAR
jgi:RNA ligase (TIGR02306 family)